jgi:fructose-specific phosphotransferase system IIC component
MIRFILLFWPALIPLLLYGGWLIVRARWQRLGYPVSSLTPHLFLAIISSLLIAALCFVVLGVEQSPNTGKDYHPTHYKDGVLIPGTMGKTDE